MKKSKIEKSLIIEQFNEWLEELPYLEKSHNTELAYRNAVEYFLDYLKDHDGPVDKLTLIDYKKHLEEELKKNSRKGKRPKAGAGSTNTINLRLTVINRIFNNLGYPDIKVKLENDTTSNIEVNTPTEEDYELFQKKAKELGKERIGLYVQTLAFTGMRISEMSYLTRQSLNKRYFIVENKGKKRYVFIPKKLKGKLLRYCRKNGIKDGLIFHGKDQDQPLDQSYIRKEIRQIAQSIDKSLLSRTNPHKWRKFFARIYSKTPNVNPFWLSDILGHSLQSRGTTTALYTQGNDKDFLNTVDMVEANYYESIKQQPAKSTRKRRRKKRNGK